jgi:acyl carrier protein
MINNRVKSVMAGVFGIPVTEISDDASTESIEKWDSLGHLNLMISLESEFRISFSDEEFMSLTSLPLLALEIRKQLGD